MSTDPRTAHPCTGRTASSLWLIAWVLGLLAAIAVLTLAGRGSLAAPSILEPAAWGPWARDRDALLIAFAIGRLLTLALAWYLLGATLIGGVARLTRWRRMVAIADLLTVPAVRRMLQSALGLGLATAALTVGAPGASPTAAAPTAPTVTMTAQDEATHVVMTPVGDTGETMTPVPQLPVPGSAVNRQWTVDDGDHFWSIAERVLRAAWERSPSDAEVDGYWRRLVAANSDRLVDPGNPDLLHPGQVVVVPHPPPRP